MQIYKIYPKGFGANAYAVTADGKNAIVIDPAAERVKDELDGRGLTPAYVLLSHAHFDHVGGVPTLQAAGAKVYCSRLEKEKIVGTYADLFDAFGAPRVSYRVDGVFEDGDEIELCGLNIKVLVTSGHTVGSACYLISDGTERALFTGDTLFEGSIGRTDFPTGDIVAMKKSLARLLAFDDGLKVYAGHEDDTTIGAERAHNPFIKEL